ncbi:MAG: hypothetical protein WDN24_22500 [Sphingomonas sp.]
MRSAILLLALPLALALAACGGVGGNTSISISDEEGNVTITSDASGRTAIKGPGIDISAKLPRIQIESADFDVGGVKLYPGSTVRDFNLNAAERIGEKDNAKLSVVFDSPASLDKVQAWFRDNMAQRGFKVAPRGTGFSGTTNDGDPIEVELQADGADKAKGRMTVGG